MTSATRREIIDLQEALKSLLFAKGFQYSDMARKLRISIATAKRVLNGADLSMERVLEICDWLGVSFHFLTEMVKSKRIEYHFCTVEQEEFLASHLQHFAYLRLLQRGEQPPAIAAEHGLKSRDMERYLRDLEREGFVERLPEQRIRLLVGDGMDWRLDGPLRRVLLERWLNDLTRHYLGRAKHGKESFIDFGHKTLTPSSWRQMKKDLDEVSRKYGMLSRVERQLHSSDQVHTYSYVMLADRWLSGIWNIEPYA